MSPLAPCFRRPCYYSGPAIPPYFRFMRWNGKMPLYRHSRTQCSVPLSIGDFFSQTCLGIEKSLLTASTRTRGPNHYFDIPHWKYLYPDYDHVQYLTVQIKVQRFDLTCDVIRNLLRLC